MGRIPELHFLWQWQRAYDDRVSASTMPTTALPSGPSAPSLALSTAAQRWAGEPTRYDPRYVSIAFPGGDVARDSGVCTDLVIRAVRDIGIDLQQRVHDDMSASFSEYPRHWGVDRADPNIDHRRVPNLMVFLARHGRVLPLSASGVDYQPGEIVTWHLGFGSTHIGIVTAQHDPTTGNPLVAHHVSGRPTLDDALFRWRITGRFGLVFSP